MEFVKGVTFAPFAPKGALSDDCAAQSLERLAARTGANMIMLVPAAMQETAQSEKIDYHSDATMSDDELKRTIDHAQRLGLWVALKPTVNCLNGTWRAHINFFDEDVPCEPKWGNWFASYTDFQLHFAKIAQESGCRMFLPGCEMVQSERRETQWRALLSELRGAFHGLLSYNTDKYQEHNVRWWDAVDVISSSGYYPLEDWERQLDRIEPVVRKYGKPFFFAECGCMSVEGSSRIPNDWNLEGRVSPEEQAEWYQAMFTACQKRDWVGGFALWEWGWRQYPAEEALRHKGYDIYAKPAEQVVARFYK